MTEMKAQLLSELPYHRIESPRKQNKYLEFFGSYIALPLMSIILVVSALILFLLVKTYFSNSYMYAFQNNLDNKNSNILDISSMVDTRYEQFNNNNRKPIYSNKQPAGINANSTKFNSLLEKALLEKSWTITIKNTNHLCYLRVNMCQNLKIKVALLTFKQPTQLRNKYN